MDILNRSEQDVLTTWDLTKVYNNLDDFYKEIEEVKSITNKLEQYKGHVLESKYNLLNCLELDTLLSRKLEKLANYAFRKLDEDISNVKSQELGGLVERLITEVSSKTAFLIPEILKEDYKKIEKLVEENQDLKEYDLLIKRIFRNKQHTLSEEAEKIISELGNILETPSKISGILRNSELNFGTIHDENGKEVQLTDENYSVFLKSPNRSVRKESFETLYKHYSMFKDTFTETIQGEVLSNVKLAKLRGFESAKEASLFYNRVDTSVYDNLIKAVHNKMDVIYKYFRLKKKESNLSDYSLYDTYINLAKDSNKKYSFEEAKKIVLNVVDVFGDEYKNTIEKAFNERWIDIYPNKGKRGGAYSAGSYDTVPYILLNYQNEYRDVSTLIHELGHSMHSYFSNKNNPYIYSSYKIFVAEVASTVNEMLLDYYMLERSNSIEEKKSILSEMMDSFKATVFRQTMFSEFEDFMHKSIENNEILTNEKLCDKYYELNKEYFGKDVIINDEIRYEWMRIPHFFYNFYVYQYATGLACACDIVRRIRNKEEGIIEGYLKFLSSGDSLDPVEELKLAGVDITKSEVIESAIDMFNDLIDEYESLV